MIDAHVVDLHALRPDRFVNSLGAAPRAADGDVEKQVKWFVERPLFVIGGAVCEAFVFKSEVVFIVDEGADFFGCPLDGVHVEG